jgi:dihydrodipicolinate synthase/N-acetylneuraminate lyase
MLAVIEGTVHRICDVTGRSSGLAALMAARVVGFTVCPISGVELTQRQICEGLTAILELGHPTAIYQLPQVTQNELSAECTARLAADYPNFYLLKDTSGDDRVARAGLDYHGVFLVRGAEGEYHRWLRTSGGCYDGFLLSSANCFARELAAMANLLAAGQMEAAARLSRRIERVVLGCFDIVSGFPFANPFTNANKIMDHVLAFGRESLREPPPYLRSGRQLPTEFVVRAHGLMAREALAPDHGYL